MDKKQIIDIIVDDIYEIFTENTVIYLKKIYEILSNKKLVINFHKEWRRKFKVIFNNKLIRINLFYINDANEIKYYNVEYENMFSLTIIDFLNINKFIDNYRETKNIKNLELKIKNYSKLLCFMFNFILPYNNINCNSELNILTPDLSIYNFEILNGEHNVFLNRLKNDLNSFYFKNTNRNESTGLVNYTELKLKDKRQKYGFIPFKLYINNDYKCEIYKGYLDGDNNLENNSHPIIPLIVFLERIVGLYDTINDGLRNNDTDKWFYKYALIKELSNLDILLNYIDITQNKKLEEKVNKLINEYSQYYSINIKEKKINDTNKIIILYTSQDDTLMINNEYFSESDYKYFSVLGVNILSTFNLIKNNVLDIVKPLANNIIFGFSLIDFDNDNKLLKLIMEEETYKKMNDLYEYYRDYECKDIDIEVLNKSESGIITGRNTKQKQYVYGVFEELIPFINCKKNFNSISYKGSVINQFDSEYRKLINKENIENTYYDNIAHPLNEWTPYANMFKVYCAILQYHDLPLMFNNKKLGIGSKYYETLEDSKLSYTGNKYITTDNINNIYNSNLISVLVIKSFDNRDKKTIYKHKDKRYNIVDKKENYERYLIYTIFENDNVDIVKHLSNLYLFNKKLNYNIYHFFLYNIPYGMLFQNYRLNYYELNLVYNYMNANLYGSKENKNKNKNKYNVNPNYLYLSLNKYNMKQLNKVNLEEYKYDTRQNILKIMQTAGGKTKKNNKTKNIKNNTKKNILIKDTIFNPIFYNYLKLYYSIPSYNIEVVKMKLQKMSNIYEYKFLYMPFFLNQILINKSNNELKQLLDIKKFSFNNSIIKYTPVFLKDFLIYNEILVKYGLINNLNKKIFIISNYFFFIDVLNYFSEKYNIKLDYLYLPDSNNIKDILNKLSINILKYSTINFKYNIFLKNFSNLTNNDLSDNYNLSLYNNKDNIIYHNYNNNINKYDFVILNIKFNYNNNNGFFTHSINNINIIIKNVEEAFNKLNNNGILLLNIINLGLEISVKIIFLISLLFKSYELVDLDIIPYYEPNEQYILFKYYNEKNKNNILHHLHNILILMNNYETINDLYYFTEDDIKLFIFDYKNLQVNKNNKFVNYKLPKILINKYNNFKNEVSNYLNIKYNDKISKLNKYIKFSDNIDDIKISDTDALIYGYNYCKKYNLETVISKNKINLIKRKNLETLLINNQSYKETISKDTKITKNTKIKVSSNDILNLNKGLENALQSLYLFNFTKSTNNNMKFNNSIENFYNNNFTRLITDNSPELEYMERKQAPRTTIHLGQRKLLFTEIEFMTKYIPRDKKTIVIYIGAAPGIHISLLIELFPNIDFMLYDPRSFDKKLYNYKNCKIFKCYFTTEMSINLRNKLKDKNYYLISDIRSTTIEEDIEDDLLLQQEWVKILKPKYSMLKFRLPRNDIKFNYLDGEVRIQLWSPITSTETRLIVPRNYKMKTWDVQKYENQLNYFNTITRVQYYPHNYNIKNFDHCYDCYGEIYILEQYFKSLNNLDSKNIKNMKLKITNLVYKINNILHYNNSKFFDPNYKIQYKKLKI